jgi:NAD(P)-dependent dehydrogenase (short-subunit alcohol dehydrogenase family)
MAQKIALVTGATNGIGIWTALGLAKDGDVVGIVARDRARGEAMQKWLAKHAPASRIDLFVAELSSLADVRRLAAEVQSRYPRLDLLINNAGLACDKRELTVDGFERTIAVNHLAPFLLVLELLDLLRRSAPARIINVGSSSSDRATLDLDNLQSERRFSTIGAYGQSKLAIMLFTFELARRLDGTGVVVNVVHPGTVATNIFNLGGWKGAMVTVLMPLIRLFLLSPEQGARTTLHVATSPALAAVTGRYFKEGKEAAPNPLSQDRALAKAVWERSAVLTRANVRPH